MSITFNNVHKTLRQKNKKTKVFEGADAVFFQDKITGVLAPPGSGKSTSAMLTTGKLRPDIGRVQRTSLVSFPVASGGIFNGQLSGRENLVFLCRVFGFDPRPIVKFIVEFAELGKVIDKPLKLYNRDERTKLMFASCYAIPFDIYVVDDSMIGGRGAFRDRCEALVRERMATSGFVIYSSSASLLSKYCNDLYIIDRLGLLKVDSVNEAVGLIGETRLKEGDGSTELVAEGGDVHEL
jgi:capsular polysaccharide transport system ATP-binding protein